MRTRVALFVALGVALAASAPAREGFGFAKKATDFKKVTPPAVNVVGSRVKVTATSTARFSDSAERLKTLTEEALTADKRFQVDSPADVNVIIELDRLETSTHTENKNDTDYEKYKDSKGKTQYKEVPKTTTETVVRGEIAGGYKILDGHGGLIDSGNIDNSTENRFEYIGTKESDLRDAFLRAASRKVANRIAPTTRKQRVLLPKGSFEAFIPLAESGAWDRYLQSVQSVPAMSDPVSESYRQYALGIAQEALAYSKDDPKSALELLRQAADSYRMAVQKNPGEKLFTEGYTSLLDAAGPPLPRAEKSVAAYEAWTSGPTPAKSSADSTTAVARQSSKPLRNGDIVEMVKAGLAEENIVTAIDSAEKTDFDTTPEGLITLSKAGVTRNVMTHVQRRGKR